MTSILPTFKPAKLYQGPEYWYVHYSYLNPATGKYVRFKEYFDINRIKDISVKRTYGKEMCSFFNQKLKEGFNPIEQATIKEQGGTTLGILQSLFEEMVKGASRPTYNTYNTMMNRLKRYLTVKELDSIRISEMDGNMADSFRDWMIDEEKLSKKSVNSTLSHLSGVWKKALKRGIAYQDPFTLVDRVKKDINVDDEEEDLYEPLTFEELQKVFNHIGREKRNFLRYLAVILYAWARPVEICRLKVNQIDLAQGYIRFRKGSTKNHRGGFVQIVQPLKKLLEEMDLRKFPGHFYIFSKDDYMPGLEQRDPKTALKSWTKVVDHLEIDKRMYALKHTGNIMYLQNNKGNTDLKWQQMQNRHSSSAMTDKYNRQLGAYFIDAESVKWREL